MVDFDKLIELTAPEIWLKEGDANSKKIHGFMSNRNRHNAIKMVHVDGVPVEGVHNIRVVVFHQFSSHFKVTGAIRPSVEDLHFRRFTGAQVGDLTKPFTLEEVKKEV